MRRQSKYAALDNLPLNSEVGDSHQAVQRRIILQSEISRLEKQLEAENAAAADVPSVAGGLQNDSQNAVPTDIKVFYAWQDDLPTEICRDFIRNAAEGACKILSRVKPEYHLVLDEGALGAPDMCDIPNTILKKIAACNIFLCDLTIVGSYTNRSSTQKKVSNPNVCFEFGLAVAHHGFRRVIGVMNTAYGRPRDQVFDVKRRWALRYNLPWGADTAAQDTARSQLTEKLVEALQTVLEKSPSRKRAQTGAARFQQIRESFESAVIDGSFHDLKPDKPILAVCLALERGRVLDLISIHGMLPPLLETMAYSLPCSCQLCALRRHDSSPERGGFGFFFLGLFFASFFGFGFFCCSICFNSSSVRSKCWSTGWGKAACV
jgi:hypothetical protein